MVTGTLRTVLWVLGALAMLWLVLALVSLPSMARMMETGGMMNGGMMQGGMMDEGAMQAGMMGGMMGMMGMMIAQVLAMLGLVGVFIYLVTDALRSRRAHR